MWNKNIALEQRISNGREMFNNGCYNENAAFGPPTYWTGQSMEHLCLSKPQQHTRYKRSQLSTKPAHQEISHAANPNLGLRRFSDIDEEEIMKQRYCGEFIMRRDTCCENHPPPPPTPTTTISDDNTSQKCLLTSKKQTASQTLFSNCGGRKVNKIVPKAEETVEMGKSVLDRENQSETSKKTNSSDGDKSTIQVRDKKDYTCSSSFIPPRKFEYPQNGLLRRINERYKKTENYFLVLKIVSSLHLILGLVMLALDWAQSALQFEDDGLKAPKKFYLIFHCLYPVYIIAIGSVGAAVALHKRMLKKTLKLLCIILLAIFCLAPSDFILVQSMSETVQYSVSRRGGGAITPMQNIFILNDDQTNVQTSHSVVTPRLIFLTSKPTHGSKFLSKFRSTSTMMTSLNERIQEKQNVLDETFIGPYIKQVETTTTVHHLRLAYCLFGGVHIVLTTFTLFTIIKLDAAS